MRGRARGQQDRRVANHTHRLSLAQPAGLSSDKLSTATLLAPPGHTWPWRPHASGLSQISNRRPEMVCPLTSCSSDKTSPILAPRQIKDTASTTMILLERKILIMGRACQGHTQHQKRPRTWLSRRQTLLGSELGMKMCIMKAGKSPAAAEESSRLGPARRAICGGDGCTEVF